MKTGSKRHAIKASHRIRLAGWVLGLGLTILPARHATAYQMGEVVTSDIVAPATFDVVDPVATAALRASEGAKTPAIFRGFSGMTNALAQHFNAAFDGAQSNFIDSIQETFHQTVLDEAAVTTPDFGYLITAFNIKNKDFPITTALGMEWAYGKSGAFEKSKLLAGLMEAMQFHIRPDALPSGFGPAETWRIVPVTVAEENLTLADVAVRGETVSKSDIMPLSQACARFRRAFTGYDEQPLARALAGWLKPNSFPDTALTQLARDRAVSELVVAEHYTAGQIIAVRGSMVDAKILAALNHLPEKPAADAPAPDSTAETVASVPAAVPDIPAARPDVVDPLAAGTDPAPKTRVAQAPAVEIAHQSDEAPVQTLTARALHHRAVVELASVSIVSALVFVGALGWQLISRRRSARSLALINDPLSPAPSAMATELAPRLVQVVREALVEELAGQRRELLYVQHSAALEVSRLVRRMDDMQMALNQRLQVYEQQIHRLEAELAARTEENHELIKMKIDMIREQRQTESVGEGGDERAAFN